MSKLHHSNLERIQTGSPQWKSFLSVPQSLFQICTHSAPSTIIIVAKPRLCMTWSKFYMNASGHSNYLCIDIISIMLLHYIF